MHDRRDDSSQIVVRWMDGSVKKCSSVSLSTFSGPSKSQILFDRCHQLLAMSSTPHSDPEKKVEVLDEDDAVLAQLGYTQGSPFRSIKDLD